MNCQASRQCKKVNFGESLLKSKKKGTQEQCREAGNKRGQPEGRQIGRGPAQAITVPRVHVAVLRTDKSHRL